MNLTGLVVARAERSHAQLVDATRAAFVAAGYREVEGGTSRVRIGEWMEDGYALITDSSIVTFDITVAKTLAADSCGALFAVRDYGYRRGKRVAKGVFLPLDGRTKWKRKPRRANHADDVRRVIEGLGVMPEPWHVESRAGTTLVFEPPAKPELFPPRDKPEQRAAANQQRIESMIANLRPHTEEQGPPDGVCQTMKFWLPGRLPERTEAVLACVTDPARRASAWSSLAREVWSGNLALDARNAKLLAELAGGHRGIAIERAVLWLCSRVLARERDGDASQDRASRHSGTRMGSTATRATADIDAVEIDDDALLDAAHIAANLGRLDLFADLDTTRVATLATARLDATDVHAAARAASVLAALDPAAGRTDIAQRAARDGAFATAVGFSRAFHLAVAGNFPAAFALWDVVQPHVRGDSDNVSWTHAEILWATHATLGAPISDPDRARRRLALALELAPDHEPTRCNAAELRKALGDPAPAAKQSSKPRRR